MTAPANDDFANRETLSGSSGSWSGTNVDATTEVGEPLSWPFNSADVGIWFEWTCPTSGRYQWDTFSVTDTVDTILNIFEGATLGGLTLFAGNDDAFFTGPPGVYRYQSCIRTDFVGGHTYMIRVDGYATGPVTVNWGAAVTIPDTPPSPAAGEIQLLDGFAWSGGYGGRWIVNIPPLPTAPGDGNVNEYDIEVARPDAARAGFYAVSEYAAVNPFVGGLIFDSADPQWFFDDFGTYAGGGAPANADTYDGAWDGPFDLGFGFTIDEANSDPDWWQPIPIPVVTSATPDPANVGDTLTIIGEHFSHVIGPTFFNVGSGYGGTPASASGTPTIVSDTEITVEVPVGAVTGEFQVGNTTGNDYFGIRINGTFGISTWAPSPAVPGERVDVVGTQFTDITDVTWGFPYATPIAQTFVIDDDEHLHFTLNPVGSDYAIGLIGVTNPSAVSPSVSPFYSHLVLEALRSPIIYTLSVTIGAPGDTVDVTDGNYFERMVSVDFVDIITGDRYPAAFTVATESTMTFVVPNVPLARSYYVEATNAAGTDINHYPGGFYVHAPAPTISSFSPIFGIAGTEVTIVGTHLTNVVEVDFNGTPSVEVTVIDDSHVTAVVPVGTTTGPVAVTDAVPQTATSVTDFTIVDPPTITGFGPVFAAPGDTITITGTGFTYVTALQIAGTAAASFLVVDDTTLTFVVPRTASGTITVTNPAGSATSEGQLAVVQPPAAVARVRLRKDRR